MEMPATVFWLQWHFAVKCEVGGLIVDHGSHATVGVKAKALVYHGFGTLSSHA